MEYPTIPITQDTWNNIFKNSKNLGTIQKYIDIKSTKTKKRKTKRKTTSTTKKDTHRAVKKSPKKTSTKKSPKKTTKQKSKKKKQRVFNAPVNFM